MNHRIPAIGLACAFALTAVSAAARAEVLWRGDFSTGDISQWPGRETVDASSRLAVIDTVAGEGPAMRALVKYGDDPINSSGNRNEVYWDRDDIGDGTERTYRWRTYWPEDYAKQDTWQLFTQWHQFEGGGSPPMAFYVRGDEVRLANQNDDIYWRAPLERGVWHEFVFHVKWSPDSAKGFIELWYDGKIAVPLRHVATSFGGSGVYLKQGLYRSDTVKVDQAVYHRGMTVGVTVEDVWPSTVVAVATPPTGAVRPPSPAPSDSTSTTGQPVQEGSGTVKVHAGCAAVEAGSLGLVGLAAFLRRRRRR